MTPADPSWVGAWWLGFVVFGGLLIVFSIPLYLFPKHMQHYYTVNNKKKKTREERSKKKLRVTKVFTSK